MAAVTSSGTAIVTLLADTQILITREFEAPKHLVYRAWTTPELIERWWSGARGEVTSVEVDLRLGGTWRYVMVANEGFEVAFHGEYRDIVPNERIVSTEIYEMPEATDEEGVLTTVTFIEADGAHDPHAAHGVPEPGDPGRDHRLRDGRRHARGDGPPRASGGLAWLSGPTGRIGDRAAIAGLIPRAALSSC